MNVLIDISHPGHVHLFKNFVFELKDKGNNVTITVKDIKAAKQLLEKYNIEFIDLGYKSDSLLGKFLNQLRYDVKLRKIVKAKKIEYGIGTSISLAHVSKLSGLISILLDDDDDEVQPLFTKFAHPFCDVLLSPDVLQKKRKRKDTIYYAGYHELAYLHPNRFTSDENILKELNLSKNENYFILRFNVFKAHHDIGAKGLNLEQKLKIVNLLLKYGKVFITTEREVEDELKDYQLKISPEKIHHLLYFATMFVGDSQTMTSEAAVLGTPAFRCNSFVGRISYLEEEEHKYGLCYSYQPEKFNDMITKIKELLSMKNLQQEWQKRRQRMLKDKIDVTAFLVWFVENYPESASIMRENPDETQKQFMTLKT